MSSRTTAWCRSMRRGNLSIDEKDNWSPRSSSACSACPRLSDRLRSRRRTAARLERDQRGHDRHHPVRVRRLADAARGHGHHGRHPGEDRRHPRHRWSRSRRRAPVRRPASRCQSSLRALDPDLLPAARTVADMLRQRPTSAISTTACRCPASTGASGRQGRGSQYGAARDHRRHGRSARDERRESHGIPPLRHATSPST